MRSYYLLISLAALSQCFASPDPEPEVSLVIGGNATLLGKFPFQVSIERDGEHWCGGTIQSRNIILTAAHCFLSPGKYRVRAGSVDLEANGTLIDIDEIRTPDDYEPFELYNDVAVVRLKGSLDLKAPNIRPVKLASSSTKIKVNATGIVLGWGFTKFKGEKPSNLQNAFVNIFEKKLCDQLFEKEATLPDTVLCAGDLKGEVDACTHDSGGPLILNGKQVGVVISGIDCALPGYPGLYTNVLAVRPWITKTIMKLLLK